MRNYFFSLIVCFAGISTGFGTGAVPTELKNAVPPPSTGMGYASFGASVAGDGGKVVVGAPRDDTGAIDAGVVKVFDAATGALLLVIPNPAPATGDQFGFSVAISGSRVVVGAPFDDAGAFEAGGAYVFELGSASPTIPVAVLAPASPRQFDYCGHSVSISGARIAMGAPGGDTGAGQSGKVVVFDVSSGVAVIAATIENPTPAHADRFGVSVALEGGRLVAGANGDSSGVGSAYLFDVAASPVLLATLANPDAAMFEFFGSSVALSGNRVVVGTPGDDTGASDGGSAYVFDVGVVPFGVVTLRNPAPVSGGYLGAAVAVSGSRVTVGARGNAPSGRGDVFVYEMGSATPNIPVHSIGAGLATEGDFLGGSVAMDGARLIVGSPFDDGRATNAGVAYVFDLDAPAPAASAMVLRQLSAPQQRPAFSQSVGVSGRWMAVGSPNDNAGATGAGAVYIYDLLGLQPTVPVLTINHPSPRDFDNFGAAIAMSGSRIVVGAPGRDGVSGGASDVGAAYVFDLASAEPTRYVAWWGATTGGARFGSSVGISGDQVAIGSRETFFWAPIAGRVSVYDLSKPFYTPPTTIIGVVGSEFGASVAISGTQVIVGAPGDDADGPNAGKAFVFDIAGANPETAVATLRNPVPDSGDNFGSAVAISAGRAAVSAVNDFSTYAGAGRAFVFDLGSPLSPQFVLDDPTPKANGAFGHSVAISGETVLVGDYMNDGAAVSSGSAAVFDLGGVNPQTPAAVLDNPFPAEGDFFGQSVALDGGNAVIGAPMDDSSQLHAGYAFHYGIDTTPPHFGIREYSPAVIYFGSAVPDYRAQAILSDAVGVMSVTQSPAPGSTPSLGLLTITLTARDAAGNESTQTFGVSVQPQPAVVTAVALKGGSAALAGLDPDVPTGSVWISIGSPALGDNGAVAFAGKWKKPGVAVAGMGLFLLSPGGDVLVAKVGGDVPGVAGATWKSFRAPSLDPTGETVVFLATIQGASVTSGDDTVLAAKVAGFPLAILAREGGEAPETGGALFKSFSSVLPADGGLVLDAKLAAGTGSPAVSLTNDRAVFEYGARNEFQGLAYREGDVRPWMNPGETLKSYNFLQTTPGSPGHGRGFYSTWALSSQRKALTDLHGHLVILTGEPGFIPALPAAKVATIGAPSEVMRLALVPGFGGVTVANRTGIFGLNDDDLLEPYLRTGDPAPGFEPGVVMNSFRDPVWNGGIAFQGVAKGGTVNSGNNDGIWWTPPGITDWRLVAREGGQPPGAPAGAQWKSFTSLALPSGVRGPFFAARLRTNAGGITPADDAAIYGTGSDGIVRELIRENQPLAGGTVRTFSTLNVTTGSAGVTRQFNSVGEILASVTFTDGSTGIVKIALP